jgi:hypothetical protein
VVGLGYAIWFRRTAENQHQAATDEEPSKDKAGDADDQPSADVDWDLDDTDAIAEMEVQVASKHNLATMWEERNLKGEILELVARKGGAPEDELGVIREGTDDAPRHHRVLSGNGVGRTRRGFSRRDLLPQASIFEEAFETTHQFSLPPEHDEDESAFQARLKRMHDRDELRRRREEQQMLLVTDGTAPGGTAHGRLHNQEGLHDPLTLTMPPEASMLDDPLATKGDDQLSGDEVDVAAVKGIDCKPIGLAARRMATMMSTMKFAAVPFGALRVAPQHELNSQLSGGTAESHMAMAAENNSVAERLNRTRFSKLYFAPQSLLDAQESDSDTSSGVGSPNSPDASPVRRFQEITRRLEGSGSPSRPSEQIPNVMLQESPDRTSTRRSAAR